MLDHIREKKRSKGDMPKVKKRQKTCIRCETPFYTDYPNGADEALFCNRCIHGFRQKVASKVKEDIVNTAKKVF